MNAILTYSTILSAPQLSNITDAHWDKQSHCYVNSGVYLKYSILEFPVHLLYNTLLREIKQM